MCVCVNIILMHHRRTLIDVVVHWFKLTELCVFSLWLFLDLGTTTQHLNILIRSGYQDLPSNFISSRCLTCCGRLHWDTESFWTGVGDARLASIKMNRNEESVSRPIDREDRTCHVSKTFKNCRGHPSPAAMPLQTLDLSPSSCNIFHQNIFIRLFICISKLVVFARSK